jgi:hypothetical protein
MEVDEDEDESTTNTHENKKRKINKASNNFQTIQKSKVQISQELLLLEFLDYIQNNSRLDDIVLSAHCKGKNADVMLLNLRKLLRSEQFKSDYIKVPDIEAIVDKHPQCDIKLLNVIMDNSKANSDSSDLKKQLEDSKKQHQTVSNEILTLTKQLAKLKVELQSEAAVIELVESIISYKFINGAKNVDILDKALSAKLL